MAVAMVFHTVLWYVALRVVDVVKDGGTVWEGLRAVVVREQTSKICECTQQLSSHLIFQGHSNARPKPPEENSDEVEDEDEDVAEEREEIRRYMGGEDGERDKVVAVEGIRKVFKMKVASKKKKKGEKKKGLCSGGGKSMLKDKNV